MAETLIRLYGSQTAARGVVAELEKYHAFGDAIFVVSPREGPVTRDELVDEIARAYVLRSLATRYADGVLRGGTLAIVHAPFGSAATAARIMDAGSPIYAGDFASEYRYREWDEATPLSSAWGLPVLSDDPAPWSRIWNIPCLTRSGSTTFGAFGVPEVSGSSSSKSSSLGLPLLSNNPAPLSSIFKLPLLTRW
jgi:hypothetical protein